MTDGVERGIDRFAAELAEVEGCARIPEEKRSDQRWTRIDVGQKRIEIAGFGVCSGERVDERGVCPTDELTSFARSVDGGIAIAKFVVAQQMRTPLFFIEWVRDLNESMPSTLEK